MVNLKVPEMLVIADKLYPLITRTNDFRYFLLEGGRGGGKSQAVGRFILYLCEKYKLRVVCGREIQNSISESVYTLLSDLIMQFQLNFTVQATKITHNKSESVINFRGFRELGSFNIQGMEGIDITWIDEAQAITKQTLDVLIPTIRKEHAKIIFSMNRHVIDDPVYDMFALRKDCLHTHIDYLDNPFCTKALINEANECKLKSIEDYNHIWLGIPLDKSEDSVFSYEEADSARKAFYAHREGYNRRIAGFDIARYGDDKCACVGLQQMGALHWETCYVEQWSKKDLSHTTGRISTLWNEERFDTCIIDEDGIGAGPLDTLTKGRRLSCFLGFRNPPIPTSQDKFFANNRTKWTYYLKDLISKGQIHITDEELLKELLTLRYTFDNYQRRILISKDVMRNKFKIKSPNKADALIMCVSLIDDVKAAQDVQYSRHPQYAKEGDILQMGGIR